MKLVQTPALRCHSWQKTLCATRREEK